MSENSKEFNNDAWKALEKRIFQMAISNTSEADTDWNTTIGASNSIYKKMNKIIFRKHEQVIIFQLSSENLRMISNILLCRGNDVLDHQFSLFENQVRITNNKY